MARDERRVNPLAEEAPRIPLGVYTPRAGVGPDDVPTDVFRPRAKPSEPQDADET